MGCIANYPITHPAFNTSCNSISKEQFRMASTCPGDLKKLKKRSGTKKIPSQVRTLKRLVMKKQSLTTHSPKLHNINKLYPRKLHMRPGRSIINHLDSIRICVRHTKPFKNVKHASIEWRMFCFPKFLLEIWGKILNWSNKNML